MNMLTSTVTHELMTPLNCILTFANSIKNTVKDEVPKTFARKIIRSSKLMKLQVHDLLDRTRAEKGELNFNVEGCNLQEVI
jgi:signal transduction histidine kinase